ncbi:IclR family transcriptional regulator [Kibdelosporangium philippinense]|uniref:IclR family transcriptional regulator n=1 Tax=Kibdelosporangium philippinense TaxID=211113 RepID=UPI0036186E6D
MALLRQVALPHMQELVDRVQESVNLMVVAATEARFVASVECTQVLRVGSRVGRTLPAHLSSGGKAILAALPVDQITTLYSGSDDVGLPRLQRELSLVRKRGFAINDQRTEAGLTAIGVVVRDFARAPVAAVAIAMPTVRFHRDRVPSLVSALGATVAAVEQDLQLHG